MHETTDRREVIVVGGGQAGLAMGYFLSRQGRDFTILEAATEPAIAWRERWDSLKLFTPARYNALPGLAFRHVLDAHQRVAVGDDAGGQQRDAPKVGTNIEAPISQ